MAVLPSYLIIAAAQRSGFYFVCLIDTTIGDTVVLNIAKSNLAREAWINSQHRSSPSPSLALFRLRHPWRGRKRLSLSEIAACLSILRGHNVSRV